jgi:nicotinamide-nucleotide amidase
MHDGGHELPKRAEQIISRADALAISLVTAESCTAGALVSLLAAAPGAGPVLQGGYVVYSKAHKTAALHVSSELIAQHSAVSAEVASAMAQGALDNSVADLSIAVTGVLGPETDEDGNPVGLVYFATAGPLGVTHIEKANFHGQSRDEILARVLDQALQLLEVAIEYSVRKSER